MSCGFCNNLLPTGDGIVKLHCCNTEWNKCRFCGDWVLSDKMRDCINRCRQTKVSCRLDVCWNNHIKDVFHGRTTLTKIRFVLPILTDNKTYYVSDNRLYLTKEIDFDNDIIRCRMLDKKIRYGIYQMDIVGKYEVDPIHNTISVIERDTKFSDWKGETFDFTILMQDDKNYDHVQEFINGTLGVVNESEDTYSVFNRIPNCVTIYFS